MHGGRSLNSRSFLYLPSPLSSPLLLSSLLFSYRSWLFRCVCLCLPLSFFSFLSFPFFPFPPFAESFVFQPKKRRTDRPKERGATTEPNRTTSHEGGKERCTSDEGEPKGNVVRAWSLLRSSILEPPNPLPFHPGELSHAKRTL